MDKRIAYEWQDGDGYWIELAKGWKNGQDPVGTLHTIHENTKREARSWVKAAVPCHCDECHYSGCPSTLVPPGKCLCTSDRSGLRWSM